MSKKKLSGWVIARVPSNKEFTAHNEISRPVLGHEWVLGEGDTPDYRQAIYGSGPSCYTPVEIRLSRKNQWTRIKRENRTERPFPLYRGYIFILEPSPSLIEDLRDRGLIYGLIPDIPTIQNGYTPGPLRLSQRAIDHMRAKYGCEYNPETGAGHQPTIDPKARMRPGYEFETGDYVLADDPAWMGHKLLCVEVLDTTARVICQMFGIDHAVELPLDEVRKAG